MTLYFKDELVKQAEQLIKIHSSKDKVKTLNYLNDIYNTLNSFNTTGRYNQKYAQIIDKNIQFIFKKSQFKIWKFFDNGQQNKDNFKKNTCTAGKCNVEEDIFSESVINYQMIQTLSDLSDDEITSLFYENDRDI